MQQEQQLMVDYSQSVRILEQMITNVSQGMYKAKLMLNNFEEMAFLYFQQDNEFRTDDLLALRFTESKPETIKADISHRIMKCQQMNLMVQERLKDICSIIEQKNPTLMKEIRKGISARGDHQGQKIDIK
jgi:hypothetical protein